MDIGTAKLPPAERGGVAAPPARRLAGRPSRRRWRSTSSWPGRPSPRSPAGAGSRCWSAARGCTCGPRWTGWSSPASRPRSGPGWRPSWPSVGPAALHARLAALDPAAAAAILPSNGRRIVRALEVIELTGGRSPPGCRASTRSTRRPDRAGPARPGRSGSGCGCDRMMELGLLDEVRRLLPPGLRDSPTAGKALGYQQLLAVLDDDGELRGDLGRGGRADRRAAPGGSCAGSGPGSAATRGCTGWTPPPPDLLDRALALLAALGSWTVNQRPERDEGPRHRERLRGAARPRRGAVAVAVAGAGAVRPARRHRRRRRAAGGPDGAGHRARRPRPGRSRPSTSWTTTTPTARSPRCAATACGCSRRYLEQAGLVDAVPAVTVATRGGPRAVHLRRRATSPSSMGPATVRPERRRVSAGGWSAVRPGGAGAAQPARGGRAGLGRRPRRAGPAAAPRVEPAAAGRPERRVRRPHRARAGCGCGCTNGASGETRSCGTGICAAVAAVAGLDGRLPRRPVAGGGAGRPVPVAWDAAGAQCCPGRPELVASSSCVREWLARAPLTGADR